MPTETCQPFRSGSMTFLGLAVTIWAGTKPASGPGGPVVFYWHGTGTNGQEATSGLSAAGIQEAVAQGGVVASFEASTGKGTNTGDLVWYTGDFDVADQILACAIQLLNVDTHRIHTAGYSAGGLQVGAMAYLRSGYLASVIVYSGGVLFPQQQNPNAIPASLGAHGAPGSDALILDFGTITTDYLKGVKAKGAFVIDCNDGSSHIDVLKRFAVAPNGWKFFKDHPYKKKPEPYTSLPAGWPSYCQII